MPRSRGLSSSSSSSVEGTKGKKISDRKDKVVCEMDVFFTDAESLYCLQYPLRPTAAPPLQLEEAYFKPKHKVLEVHANHAACLDGPLKLSSTVVPNNTNLGVAVINEKGLHISPVSDVLQLRPVFRNIPGMRGDDPNTTDKVSDDDEPVRNAPQQVLLKKKESDRAASARVQSYAHVAALEEGEPFVHLEPCTVERDNVVFEALYYKENEEMEVDK